MPVPNDLEVQPVDRKAATAAVSLSETPGEARARKAAGGPMPAHYAPTPPREGANKGAEFDLANYGKTGTEKAAKDKSGAKQPAPGK